uniref:Huluwa n=1 Tax=Echeneis naucrates TaxID=173247 RepID=A0A665W2L7_ECHNA
MSQTKQTTPSNVTEGHPVTDLTLVVLLLIPCVIILLLLNCLFLGYKLLMLSKISVRRKSQDAEEMLLQSTLRRVTSVGPLQAGRREYMSVSEPVLPHPVTSSRASSRERAVVDHRTRLLRPDGATGSWSLRAPTGWCRSAPLLPQSSESEAETRGNLVPPNSPMVSDHSLHEPGKGPKGHFDVHLSRSSYQMLTDVNPGVAVHVLDKANMECEYTSPPSETSCLSTSAVGPGLDSDFGASAGVSLRILSADSDGLSNGVLASALEWDYYDPCYVKQNNVPKHKHHRPAVHTKQYWV